ncbi:hypothetical protein AVEN_158470-1 [Araneus ventricosus]|uniref:Uncharacterized protein n=1 Tax=Araneus ventricosus TaxID=182803 RepID=A0A4Y2WS79_ARAVE|nr:hypothetical protein AVEN_158470-1 [Araneus ventricosus]
MLVQLAGKLKAREAGKDFCFPLDPTNFMPGDDVNGVSFEPFLLLWCWLPHMPTLCENTLCVIVKCRANSTTTAIIAVREVKPFQVGRERSMLREDNILSNPVSRTETN